jgi:hypothetical protein
MVIDEIKKFLNNFENISGFTNTGIILSNYGLFVSKGLDALQISIVEKRGLYNCEDDIFHIKLLTETDISDSEENEKQYEFWDTMNYLIRRKATLEEIVTILVKACSKINVMYKVLHIQRIHKPALLDSVDLLFSLQGLRHCAIEYNPKTGGVKIISHCKTNKCKLL